MSIVKKLVCVILCIVIVGAVFAAVALRMKSDDGYTKTIVFIGDSISEGLLGTTPLSERDSYGFYAVVGRRNNYRYVESSVSGDTVAKMYGRLTNTDTPSLERQYWLTQADIIHISILGNDLLGGNIGQTAMEALKDDYTNINVLFSRAGEYFALSVQRVKELNPNALILVNTLYNPLDAAGTLLTPAQKAALIDYADGDETVIRRVGAELITKLNGIVYDYLDAHPGAYEVIDVYNAFNDIYNRDYEDGVALFYGDWLHPSNEGHGVMADLIQNKLEQKELADKKFAVTRYKTLRTEQIERLFEGTSVDLAAAKKAIKNASDCEEITHAYFKAVRGVTPIYADTPIVPREGKIFEATKIFNLSSIKMGGEDYTDFADTEISKFTFKDDGTFTVELVPDEFLLAIAKSFIYLATQNGGLNLSESLGAGNFGTGIEAYIKGIFPGFDFRYLKKDFELITSCGIYVNGLDYDNPEIKALLDSMETSMTIPSGFVLPEEISFELKGYYFVEKLGEFTDIHMCVGNVSSDGYPFLYATLHQEADGSEWIELSIEVSKITVTAGK